MTALDLPATYPFDLDALPEGWEWSMLGDASDEVRSGFASGRHNSTGDGVPHLRPMNVSRQGTIDLSDVKYVSPDKDDRRVEDGDVLFNNTNSPVLVGKTAVVRNPGDWAFSNHMTRIRTGNGVDPAFLAMQLHHMWQSGYFKSICVNHVNQASVSAKRLASVVPVLLPPLEVQCALVEAIEDLFSRLDRATQGATRAALTCVALQSQAEHDLLAGEYPSATIEDLSTHIVDCLHSTPRFVECGRVCLDTNSMAPGRIERERLRFVDDETFAVRNRRLTPEPGDVVLAREGSAAIGFAVVIPDDLEVCLGQRVMLIRPDSRVTAEYIEAVLNSRVVKAQYVHKIRGSASPHLNMSDIRLLRVPVPPARSQRSMIRSVQELRATVGHFRQSLDDVKRRGAALRSSILSAAFSGRLNTKEVIGV